MPISQMLTDFDQAICVVTGLEHPLEPGGLTSGYKTEDNDFPFTQILQSPKFIREG